MVLRTALGLMFLLFLGVLGGFSRGALLQPGNPFGLVSGRQIPHFDVVPLRQEPAEPTLNRQLAKLGGKSVLIVARRPETSF